jgi:hypothetical protein
MSIFGQAIGGAAGQNITPAEPVKNSVYLAASDSEHFVRTFGTPTDQSVFTFSFWTKRTNLYSTNVVMRAASNNEIIFNGSDKLVLTLNSTNVITTTRVFRDVAAWYHFVWVANGTSHTIYLNGVNIATGTGSNPAFNASGNNHRLGRRNFIYYDGYFSEVHWVDGQALSPTDFGEFDTDNIWQAKEYTGTYGNNGFYLDFSDSAALGTDNSGNGNDWTPANVDATNQTTDSPDNNYCLFNQIALTDTNILVGNGNLEILANTSTARRKATTICFSSGKWYAEFNITVATGGDIYIGIMQTSDTDESGRLGDNGGTQGFTSYGYRSNGSKRTNNTDSSYGAAYTQGDIIGVAIDLDAGNLVFYKNGVSQGTAFTGITGTWMFAVSFNNQAGNRIRANFGSQGFDYNIPVGHGILYTQDLPTPTFANGNEVMDAKLWNGNNSSSQTISGLNYSPDIVWIKGRNITTNHVIYDTERGANNQLIVNSTPNETTVTSGLTSFTSDGFVLSSGNDVNGIATNTYVGWSWDSGSSGVTNTDGTITSTVRTNTTAGISTVLYTGNGNSSATVGHGLGVAPAFMIVKRRNGSTTARWNVYHTGLGATQYIELNEVNGASSATNRWQDTEPDSTVFTLGASNQVNDNNDDYVAYLWTPIQGYSTIGTFEGSRSGNDAAFVGLEFTPKWILIKNSDSSSNWVLYDTERDPVNLAFAELHTNDTTIESSSTANSLDFLSNGFKCRDTSNVSDINTDKQLMIYIAFAENPFKLARAR